jgi:apolipoprotein N-acyltransferase
MGDPAAAPPKPPFLRTRFLPALLSAGLFYLCFFPVNWGWLGWVALVPLLWLAIAPDPRRVLLASWLGGLIFSLAAVEWIRLANEFMYVLWVLLAFFISLAMPAFVWLTRLLIVRLRFPLILAAPTAWVASEYIRAVVNVGFPWYYLGHTQHECLPAVQIADLFGAYGVSFVVMMVNVAVFEIVRWGYAKVMADRGGQTHVTARSPVLALTAAGVALVLALSYGWWRLADDHFEQGTRVALIQGNLPQDIHDDENMQHVTATHFRDLADQARDLKPDLLVWSETSWPFTYCGVDSAINASTIPDKWHEMDASGRVIVHDMHERYVCPTLLGIQSLFLEPDGEKHYNTALLIDRKGKLVDHYHKIALVPFGEFIPWQDYIPFLKWLSPYSEENDYGIAAGTRHTVFELEGRKFGVLICYEDSVTFVAREFMRQERVPDFFLNISNDGWFHGSEEHEQHFVAARFRAIECRRAIGRAVNMGVSGIIDGNGRIVALPGPTLSKSKKCTAVITGAMPIDHRSSLYVFWGDVLPQACWLASFAGIAAGVWRRMRRERASAA